jgi:transcriptional regulator with XRE-family HTH domain
MQPDDNPPQPTDDHLPEACFAQRLRERREALGWSQTALAEALRAGTGGLLKLDPTAITRIERGNRTVGLNEAVGFATVLGVGLDELVSLHPGDLSGQVSRAHADHENARWAEHYWTNEVRRRKARLDELREELRLENLRAEKRREMFMKTAEKSAEWELGNEEILDSEEERDDGPR